MRSKKNPNNDLLVIGHAIVKLSTKGEVTLHRKDVSDLMFIVSNIENILSDSQVTYDTNYTDIDDVPVKATIKIEL